jgi:hypothetical protein
MVLTLRDEHIVRWVYELRFVTHEQIQELLFTPTTASSCKRRLTLLYHNGYLDRRLIPLRSRFGANRAAYCLDRKGKDLLVHQTGTGLAQIDWRPADNDREQYFLEHLLSTNQVRICVTIAAAEQGFDLTWVNERALRSSAMRDLVKDPKNPATDLAVIPDGYFQLATDDLPLGFAVELDRATVEERQFKTKVRALGQWKTTGAYRQRFGTGSLRVLFVVEGSKRDPNRLTRIKSWAEHEGAGNLFWFAPLSEISRHSIFQSPIWQVAGRTGSFALFD